MQNNHSEKGVARWVREAHQARRARMYESATRNGKEIRAADGDIALLDADGNVHGFVGITSSDIYYDAASVQALRALKFGEVITIHRKPHEVLTYPQADGSVKELWGSGFKTVAAEDAANRYLSDAEAQQYREQLRGR
ncbi:MAG: hypothetical protein DI582_06120 [Azospirillum brasilense]|nr:MAG: hypothetical protein DI582_06120 [Azospirillum brasilense]